MKKTFSIGLIALATAALAGCSDESSALSDGRGRVSLDLSLDSSVTRADGMGRAAGDLTAEDLKLKMTSADGAYSKTWDSAASFNAETSFTVGDYTLEAFYGDAATEDFDAPYYYGSVPVKITDGGNTTVSLTAALANSMVTVEYTEAFLNYFTAYGARLHSEGGSYIEYPAGETRAAYIKPGKCEVIISVTKPNGQSVTLQPTGFTAKAKTHHKVTFDVNNGNVGDALLLITFDETVLDGEAVEIELSDELMNAPAPAVSPKGFTNGQTLSVIEGNAPDGDLRANIVARGGLKSVTLTTQSRSLQAQGWPAEVDLMAATDAQKAVMQQLGFEQLGLWGTPDKLASVNFAGIISHIAFVESGANTTTFTLLVKDKYGKVQEQPLTLNVNVDKMRLELANGTNAYLGGTTLEVDLTYNGGDIANVTMQAAKESGTYADVAYTVMSHTGDTYHLQVTVPAITRDIKLRAKCGSLTDDLTVTAQEAPFKLTYSDLNTFAKHAALNLVSNTGESSADVAARATLYVSTDGTNYTKANATLSGSEYNVTGLEPATRYYFRATAGNVSSASVELTTETDAQIPNGNLDADVTFDGSDNNWENVVFSGWGTNNAMTTSERPRLIYGYICISGTIQETGVSGKCALIRNVGWGEGNTATGSGGNGGECKYVDVGLLHLGSTRTARPSGYSVNDNTTSISGPTVLGFGSKTYTTSTGPVTTDDLDCGISFASRPSSMTFQYKYSPKNAADKGYALVTVYDAAGNVIVTKDVNLDAASSWTAKTLTLDYPANAAKCGKIYVKFLSSYSMEYVKRTNDNYSGPGFGNLARGTYMGSQLYIDEVKLNY